ncbi:hypothetical protein DYB38_001852 [Aphanomyces astaci]|uniref:PH domain-containing protein n=1 Tax=Aphanomyces astaci TaxID=112090 RepID=A0A397DEU5_APHAT|nr:hypothetical protein DYB38_001852 [Aphanomyces astaci]
MRDNQCNSQALDQMDEEAHDNQQAHDSRSTTSAAPSIDDMLSMTAPMDHEGMTETSSEVDTDEDKNYESQYLSLGQQYGARSKQKRQERRMQELLDQKMQSFNGVSRAHGTSVTDPVRHTFSSEFAPPRSISNSSSTLNSSRPSMVMGPVLQSIAQMDVHDGHRRMRSFEGWLLKRGQRVKNWKRRYFTLNGQELKYSQGPGEKPKGFGMVVGVKTSPELAYALSISMLPTRVLDVQAESTDEQEAWLQRLLVASSSATTMTPSQAPSLSLSLPNSSAPLSVAVSPLPSHQAQPQRSVDLYPTPPPSTISTKRNSSLSSQGSSLGHDDESDAIVGHNSSIIMDTASECEGWLYKQGSFVRNWKKRWFSLTHQVLSYRDMQSSVTIKGHGCVHSVQRSTTTHAFGLVIELDNHRKLHVYADDADTQKRWHHAIARILQPSVAPLTSGEMPQPQAAPMLSASQTLFKQSKTHGGEIKNFSGGMSIPSGLFNASWTRCFFTLHGVELAQSEDTSAPVARVGSIQKVLPWEGKPGGLEFHMLGQKNVWRTLCPSVRAATAWVAAIQDCLGRTRYTIDKFLRSADAKQMQTTMCGWLTRLPAKQHGRLRQYYVLHHLTMSVANDVDLPPQEVDVVTAILSSEDRDCALVFKFSTAPDLVLECDSVDSWTRWQRIVRTCLKEPQRAHYSLS